MTSQKHEISIISSSSVNKQQLTENDGMEFSAALEETSKYLRRIEESHLKEFPTQ